MNFTNWEFSIEVQPELNRFLHVVSQNKNPECNLHERIFQVIPELKDLQQNKSFIGAPNTSATESEVIVLDDDDPMDEVVEQQLPDISVLNLTQATPKHAEEVDSNVNSFVEYLLECLENENLTLEDEYISKFVTYNNSTLNYLFNKLFVVSDNGVYNLNKCICKNAGKFPFNVPQMFCKNILFCKLKVSTPSAKLLAALKEYYESFSDIIQQELLATILIPDFGDNNFYEIIINTLSDSEKQYVLRDFVQVVNDLELWQLSILDSLISLKSEDYIKRSLINLIKVSADKFKTEKLFVKLLITLINCLESDFEDQEDIIHNIIMQCKTTNKIIAQKALKKWANKFNNI